MFHRTCCVNCILIFLTHYAQLLNLNHIVTGHHLDDDIETLFLKTLRSHKGLILGILQAHYDKRHCGCSSTINLIKTRVFNN